jgi:hypothetical protein
LDIYKVGLSKPRQGTGFQAINNPLKVGRPSPQKLILKHNFLRKEELESPKLLNLDMKPLHLSRVGSAKGIAEVTREMNPYYDAG